MTLVQGDHHVLLCPRIKEAHRSGYICSLILLFMHFFQGMKGQISLPFFPFSSLLSFPFDPFLSLSALKKEYTICQSSIAFAKYNKFSRLKQYEFLFYLCIKKATERGHSVSFFVSSILSGCMQLEIYFQVAQDRADMLVGIHQELSDMELKSLHIGFSKGLLGLSQCMVMGLPVAQVETQSSQDVTEAQ